MPGRSEGANEMRAKSPLVRFSLQPSLNSAASSLQPRHSSWLLCRQAALAEQRREINQCLATAWKGTCNTFFGAFANDATNALGWATSPAIRGIFPRIPMSILVRGDYVLGVGCE